MTPRVGEPAAGGGSARGRACPAAVSTAEPLSGNRLRAQSRGDGCPRSNQPRRRAVTPLVEEPAAGGGRARERARPAAVPSAEPLSGNRLRAQSRGDGCPRSDQPRRRAVTPRVGEPAAGGGSARGRARPAAVPSAEHLSGNRLRAQSRGDSRSRCRPPRRRAVTPRVVEPAAGGGSARGRACPAAVPSAEPLSGNRLRAQSWGEETRTREEEDGVSTLRVPSVPRPFTPSRGTDLQVQWSRPAEVRGERRLNRPRPLQSSAAGSDRIPGDHVGRAMQPD